MRQLRTTDPSPRGKEVQEQDLSPQPLRFFEPGGSARAPPVSRIAAACRTTKEHGQQLQAWSLPVVAETWDGLLNDINGFHVKPEHVFAALDGARSGRVPEGNVGGGTGMRCYGFKCGTGTSSRKIDPRFGGYTIGVLVQANHGTRELLRVAGVPVGQELSGPRTARGETEMETRSRDALGELGSIIIVVGKDAPLLPHQLKRVARRASLGLGRTGSVSSNGSGDIFVAFSTANAGAAAAAYTAQLQMMSNARIGALFEACQASTDITSRPSLTRR